jgi:hypothetical protein
MNQALRPVPAINRQQRIDDMYSRVRIEEAMEQWRKAPKE